ncbi:anhydro-N-acetylmuramic acid kinase [Sulfurimonas sp.]|uniref:anhydro-N-acetylmuramic acid kinase n=1 Tax=Sulfurimonas sp. TaxID=2022749 RepID=UPI002636AE02|nr:anhydro-N-acetylmuramic acid kinase [Sulfurimonas sp.]
MKQLTELYIGVMSGTSLDGVDVALCELSHDSCKLIHSLEYPLPAELKAEILSIINAATSIKEVGSLHTKLGQLFSDALNALLTAFDIDARSVNAVGLHGQTLWHEPNAAFPFSLQLGNANVVAAQTHTTTVADFRGMDIANGGEGAPFAPAFHHFLFGSSKIKRGVVNIGGMANLTVLGEKLLGFDVGCGNVLLDYWVDAKRSQKYDKDGLFAKSGKVHNALLDALLADAYFQKAAPKSTGREYFNAAWLESKLTAFSGVSDADVQRTLLELTAQSIANELKIFHIQELILCGGGAKNNFLVERLNTLCECEVTHSEAYGVDGDFLEAMLFAWLAHKRLHKEKVALKSVTGAKTDSILGAIYEAS